MMPRAVALVAFAAAACSSASAPTMPKGAPASLEATAAGSGDAIVARVDGHPVWGSCVAAQVARMHVDAHVALQQCIDFELLARAADQRGLATDPEVVDATRDALVNRLVELGFEDAFTKPGDFGAFWDDVMVHHKAQYHYKHVEYRASTYVRVPVAQKPPFEDPAARAIAERIAAAVANERGLFASDFVELAQRAAGDAKLQHADVPPYQHARLEGNYGDALWAIPEIGRTSPVVRSDEGYDVILWTDDVPAAAPSPDELVREALPEVQREFFAVWVGKLAHAMNLHVEPAPDVDDLLEKQP
ncbi:MAG TPA: hypothetical protein VGF94_19305 [Kofleriaceae bacterium]|jgi:hypothetical protein